MKNPLDTLAGTITLGVIITIVLYYVVHAVPTGT